MKLKKWFVAGTIIFVLGLALLITGLALGGNHKKNVDFTMEKFTAAGDISELDIDCDFGIKLSVVFYDGDNVSIDYPSFDGLKTELSEMGGRISYGVKAPWSFNCGGALYWSNLNIPETVISIPQTTVLSLNADISSGTVNIADGKFKNVDFDFSSATVNAGKIECEEFCMDFSSGKLNADSVICKTFESDMSSGKVEVGEVECDRLKSELSSGVIYISSVTCPDIYVTTSSGSVTLGVNGANAEYSIDCSVSSGSCNVHNQTGTTSKRIKVHCSSGTINISFK